MKTLEDRSTARTLEWLRRVFYPLVPYPLFYFFFFFFNFFVSKDPSERAEFYIDGFLVAELPALRVRLRPSSSSSRDVTWKKATAAASSRKAAC